MKKEEVKTPLIILTGPTAVGKTALSVKLAQKSRRRDHLRRFHAGLPAYGYRFGQDPAG